MLDRAPFDALLRLLEALSHQPAQRPSVASASGLSIAFSGGLDSRFLTHAALHVLQPQQMQLLHVTGPHIPDTESAFAQAWAASRGLELTLLPLDPLKLPEVAQGHELRCYACKATLFAAMLERATWLLCDGSNASDQSVYRPGLRALTELGIRSPLAEAGLAKPVLRELGRATGLERPDQQARPCLLTRLPYGVAPTPDKLRKVAAMEAAAENGLRAMAPERPEPWDFRVRLVETAPERFALHVGHPLTEAQQAELRNLLAPFAPCAVVCAERISGYFDATRENAVSGSSAPSAPVHAPA